MSLRMTVNLRMTVTAAMAVVLTSTIMFPLFSDSLWFVSATGAVIAVAAAGLLSRLRTLPAPACLAGSLACLLLYLNLVFEGSRSLLGVIPTPGSLGSLAALARAGMDEASRYAPAVPNLPGLLLLATAGVGITAVLTDVIAVRLRSAALAGLPLLALFSVPVMMNADKDQFTASVVFCLGGAGYLAMLSADGRERIRLWGRLVSLWRGSAAGPVPPSAVSGAGPDTRALAAAGRRVGLASIVLALCAPLLLPGLHPSKLFSSGPGIGGPGGPGGAVAPGLSGVAAQTLNELSEHPSVVFTYRTNAPAALERGDPQYFQQYVLQTLTASQGWISTGYANNAVQVAGPLPAPAGLADPAAAAEVTTTVHAAAGFPAPARAPVFLPMFYPPAQLSVPGTWMVDPDLMVYSAGGSVAGRSYQVQSLVVDPTSTQLSQAAAPAVNLAADLRLPSSYKAPALEKLAAELTRGYRTEYAKAEALATWLQEVGTYSTSAPGFSTAAGLITFLTRTRSGVCVQFAWAMTVLARLAGIPARFVVGYTPGTPAAGGTYQVTTSDAHAWTEVYFQGYGWVRFEPTPPGQGTASDPNYMGAGQGAGSSYSGPPDFPGATAAPAPRASAVAGQLGRRRAPLGLGGPVTGTASQRAGTPWTAIALAVIAAIAAAGATIALAGPSRTRRGRGEAPRARPVSITSAALILAAAGLVALTLYRLLARTSGLDLSTGWETVGIAFGATAAAVLVLPALVRPLRRRWRWMRAADDVSRAHAAWRDFHDDLADFGIRSRPSEPPRTLACRLAETLPPAAAEAVRRLALAEERASYSARPAPSSDLRRDSAQARRGLAATARRGARLRAAILPLSLLSVISDGTGRLTSARPAPRPAGARRHRFSGSQ